MQKPNAARPKQGANRFDGVFPPGRQNQRPGSNASSVAKGSPQSTRRDENAIARHGGQFTRPAESIRELSALGLLVASPGAIGLGEGASDLQAFGEENDE